MGKVEDFRKHQHDHQYIGDIRQRFIDNFNYLWEKKMHDHWFDTLKEAWAFHWETFRKCLDKLGIDSRLILAATKMEAQKANTQDHAFLLKRFNQALLDHDVEIIPRIISYRKKKDFKKNGMYLKHHDEIAYFVSSAINIKGGVREGSKIIVPNRTDYLVRTNYTD